MGLEIKIKIIETKLIISEITYRELSLDLFLIQKYKLTINKKKDRKTKTGTPSTKIVAELISPVSKSVILKIVI